MNPVTIPQLIARWSDPAARPLFKGKLIDDTGCRCAQGDILHLAGWSDAQLVDADQSEADQAVAELLGISRFQSALLRLINDRQDGQPQEVLTDPSSVLGDTAPTLLAFGRHIDRMTPGQWVTAGAASWVVVRTAARAAVWDAAKAAVRTAAWATAGAAAWRAAGATAGAACEIQGAAILRANGRPFFFLPLFGFADPEAVLAADTHGGKA